MVKEKYELLMMFFRFPRIENLLMDCATLLKWASFAVKKFSTIENVTFVCTYHTI